MNRHREIRYLNKLASDEIIKKCGDHLKVMRDTAEIDTYITKEMLSMIEENNQKKKSTTAIFPYGPVGQYYALVRMINKKNVSLKNTTIFFMDEYAGEDGREIPEDHPLSFKGRAKQILKDIRKDLLPDFTKIIFPSSDNIHKLKSLITDKGPVQVCFGGIGIHGHLAFNEPESGVRNTDPRLVRINDYTVTINAIRENIGGNVINFPKQAYTIGMNQIFNSQKIILSCRNGLSEIDWANTALRLALLGESGDDFPATYLRDIDYYTIITDEETLKSPEYVI